MGNKVSRVPDLVLIAVISVGTIIMMSSPEYYGGSRGRMVTVVLIGAGLVIAWWEFSQFNAITKILGYVGTCAIFLLIGVIAADLIAGSIGVVTNLLNLVVFGAIWYLAFYRRVRRAKRATAELGGEEAV